MEILFGVNVTFGVTCASRYRNISNRIRIICHKDTKNTGCHLRSFVTVIGFEWFFILLRSIRSLTRSDFNLCWREGGNINGLGRWKWKTYFCILFIQDLFRRNRSILFKYIDVIQEVLFIWKRKFSPFSEEIINRIEENIKNSGWKLNYILCKAGLDTKIQFGL